MLADGHLESSLQYLTLPFCSFNSPLRIFFTLTFRVEEGGRGRERIIDVRDTLIGCLLQAPQLGPGMEPDLEKNPKPLGAQVTL